MSHYCTQCSNSGERDMRGNLDCMAPGCTAAEDRAALELHLLALGRLHERDMVWEAYKLGEAKEARTPLTDADIEDLYIGCTFSELSGPELSFARAIEERHGISFAAPTNNSTESTNDKLA